MPFTLALPDIGEGIVEAEVQQWFVKPGDDVAEDAPLVEVMTDKATVVIPSPKRGRVVRLFWKVGDVAKVHAPLVELEVEESAPAAARKALAAPAVRAMAREIGIDIGSVPGTGPGGRVTKEDLALRRTRRNGRQAGGSAAIAATSTATTATAKPIATPTPPPTPPPATSATPPTSARTSTSPAAPAAPSSYGDERVPLRGVRRRMAENMARSKRTAAHFTFVEQADVTELVRAKDRIAEAALEEGVKVAFLPFVVKAVVAALRKHPTLNATMDEERAELVLHRRFDLGIAAATEGGLVVPVLRGADRRSLLDVAREVERLAADAKSGRLRPEDVGRSTFTITSLGALGGLFATPVLNHPEVAILGVHRIRPTPLARDGQVVVRDVMHVSVTCDHRVVDGREAAAFAYDVIRGLEDPNLLFMHMA